MIVGTAELYYELDGQYTTLISKKVDNGRQALQTTNTNQTLANAFDSARDTLAAYATGSNKHLKIKIITEIDVPPA